MTETTFYPPSSSTTAKTYYPLTHDEFLQLNDKLKDADLRTYLYLMTLNPFPDSSMEIDTARISEQLGLTRRTIQRAVKRLQELELIEIEITKFKYKKAAHGSSSRLGSSDIRIASKKFGDPNVAGNDPNVASTCPKPLDSKDSETPHTLNIKKEFKDTTEKEGGALKIFERYEQRLKLYGIHRNIWKNGEIVPNPRMKSILEAIATINEETAEQNLKAFFEWADRTKGVKDVYAALRAAILKGWRG